MLQMQAHSHLVKAENIRSLDIGIEKTFADNKFKIDLTYFDIRI